MNRPAEPPSTDSLSEAPRPIVSPWAVTPLDLVGSLVMLGVYVVIAVVLLSHPDESSFSYPVGDVILFLGFAVGALAVVGIAVGGIALHRRARRAPEPGG